MLKKVIFILYICACIVFVPACGSDTSVMVKNTGCSDAYEAASETDDSESDDSGDEVAVYICGAVVNPGVYYVPSGSLKQEALMAAGGFADGAALDYVNLAERVCDGERLYFPYEEELHSGIDTISDEPDDGRVNINTADAGELMTLPGIGESKANAIISYREENGAFSSIEEIMNITGIKEGVYNNIKDFIVVK